MGIRTSPWPAGVPCWADLTAPDVGAALAFYAAVLGWSSEGPQEQFGDYAIAQVRGAAVAGIGPQQQQGTRPAWTLYLASDDVDTTAATVTANGGALLIGPGDVGPLGRMCIATDPSGAAFGVWQAGSHIGAGLVNEPGGLCWEDLRSTDPAAAQAFYTAVFGFGTEPIPQAGPDYRTFAQPGERAPLGGMGGMMGAPEGTPSHWEIYFGVADAAAAAATAEANGGTVLAPAFQTPFGLMAAVADPAGAVFWAFQTDWSDMPDRAG